MREDTRRSIRKGLMHNRITSGSHSDRFPLSLPAHTFILGNFLLSITKFKAQIC